MKKRIFGMLLMGAMVVASMSMFTSCKDYDDDINANKAEIAALKTSLQEQKTSLEAAIAAAKSEASTANATLNTKLTELTTLVGNNKTELENAIKAAVTDSKAYADGVSAEALKTAQAYADAAAQAAAATAKAEGLEEAKKALDELAAQMAAGDEANAKAIAEKADELVAKISAVDTKLVSLIDAEKEERISALAAVNTQIENIKLQIAALEEFKTTISKQVSDIAEDLDKTKAVLESVKKAAEDNAKAIKENKAEIAKINTALTVIDGKIAGLEEQVELLKKADADLKELIAANTAEIAAVKTAYQAADAALKQEFEALLKKDYYTKAEINEILKGYAKTTVDGYTVPADVEKYVSEVKADMENQITETLNAYDQKLAAALVALFGADDAEGAAAADVEMSEEAIEALKKLKENYTNGINKQVEEQLNVLKTEKGKQLTSLVFRPDFYENGIEAVEVVSLKDTILALVDESKRAKVTELWGIKGAARVVVPDSALTTWYEIYDSRHNGGPAYVKYGWKDATGKSYSTIDAAFDKNAVQYYVCNPISTIDYHVNPTTADLDGAELSFYTNVAYVQDDPGATTRAAGPTLATPVPAKIEKTSDMVENGILTVPFNVDRDVLNSIRYTKSQWGNRYYHNGNEAFIALQAHVKGEEADTVVTSDYALLVPSDIDIVALSRTWKFNPYYEDGYIGDNHLWTKLIAPTSSPDWDNASGFLLYEEGKLNNVPYYSPIEDALDITLPVQFDGSVDLSQVIETHYRVGLRSLEDGDDFEYEDRAMTPELMEKLGLHYEFEAIHYISGSNKTDEWEHIQLSGDNNCIATPRSVNEKGKRIDDEVAGREVIGRMPIVRASLVNNDGEVLAIGYILIEIVSPEPATTDITIDLGDAYMNCTGPAALTWAQVEALILKEVQLSKTEFEATYHLVSADWNDVDLDGRYFSGVSKSWGDKILADELVDADFDYQGTAYQFTKKRGRWERIADYNDWMTHQSSYIYAQDWQKPDLLIHPIGSVYERRNYEGQQTTVLEWNVGSQVEEYIASYYDEPAGDVYSSRQSMTKSIDWAIKYSGASAASKGLSTNDVEVTIAFANNTQWMNKKYDNGMIFVTLRIPAGKLHFAYAEATGKDLSHWYQNNNYLNAADELESDAAEIHINVPTPALGGSGAEITRGTGSSAVTYAGLQDVDFGKVIDQTFIGNLVKKGSFDKNNFTKFTNTEFSFKLVEPVAGVTSTNITAEKNKKITTGNTSAQVPTDKLGWTVKGVTGNEYLLYLTTDGDRDAIMIAGYKDAANSNKVKTITNDLERTVVVLQRNVPGAVKVTTANPEGLGAKIALMPNRYAQDIVNYTGRYDMFGTDNNTSYLDNSNKTFTAFIEIVSGNPCYKLMMPNSYFKARFLRPINVLRKTKDWTDAQNVIQTVKVAEELVKLIDWRGYTLTTANKDDNDITKCTVDAKFYGIADSTYKHFFVDTLNIYTDHGKAVGSRVVLNDVAAIENLNKRDEFESLSSKFLNFNTADGTLTYRNNETNVGTFHLYVPVYVTYSFGEFDYGNVLYQGISSVNGATRFNYQNVSGDDLYAPFNANRDQTDHSVNKATAVTQIKRPLYTLKTYAVIKVKQTTNSGTQTGARQK